MKVTDRISHAWNAFRGNEVEEDNSGVWFDYGTSYSSPNYKTQRAYSTADFSAAIFNRIALDVSMSTIQHVKVTDENADRITIESGLHNCLNVEANIDQTGIQFMHDIVYSMFDEGSVAVVPVDTTISPNITGGYDIKTMRVGRITQWYPQHVKVMLYNENTGQSQEIVVSKSTVAIIENPLYAVVNGPNATFSRLLRKMALLDATDEDLASGKLDLLIQLPHAVKTDLQRTQSEERIKNIETQLGKNSHGIAYIDGSEKVTQLNRTINATLGDDITELSQQFYNQLGLTANVFNGTASESEMRGYYTRTIDPILNTIMAEFSRKFITKTARTQGQTLESYRDPFSLVPVEQLAKIGDTMKRNSILTSNELRGIMGFRAHNSPEANELSNPNIADKNQIQDETGSLTPPDESSQNE